jgi:hypothetical protein
MSMSNAMRPRFLEGERVYLSALVPEDAEDNYPGWFNDAKVCKGNGHHVFPYTREEACKYVEDIVGNRSSLILAIISIEDNVHIGNVSLQKIDYFSRSAKLAILIGEKRFWEKVLGERLHNCCSNTPLIH